MYTVDGMSRATCEIRSLVIIERETSSWVLTKLSPFWRRATCTNMGCKSASVIRTSVCVKIIKKLSYNYSHFTWNLEGITSAFYADALWVPIDRHAISWEEEWRDESKERLRRLDLPNENLAQLGKLYLLFTPHHQSFPRERCIQNIQQLVELLTFTAWFV